MKLFLPIFPWVGGLMDYLAKGFKDEGYEVRYIYYDPPKHFLKKFKLHNIPGIGNNRLKKDKDKFNEDILKEVAAYKPDLFFVMNYANVYTETIEEIHKSNCRTACWIADNPFDSFRYTYLPMSLRYFDHIFVGEKYWVPSIKNVAPKAKIHHVIGGYSPGKFFPVEKSQISDSDNQELSCEISFTGESYGLRAEGAYRAGILEYVSNFDLNIWGDNRWRQRFKYYPGIEKAYRGERLSFDKLRKLYTLSTVNLNMPAPQVLTSFQPRLFEIAACKGFQIVDWREELDELFEEDELVTFKNIPELIEKANYFINNPNQRLSYIDKLYEKVWDKHTWQHRAKEVIEVIKSEL